MNDDFTFLRISINVGLKNKLVVSHIDIHGGHHTVVVFGPAVNQHKGKFESFSLSATKLQSDFTRATCHYCFHCKRGATTVTITIGGSSTTGNQAGFRIIYIPRNFRWPVTPTCIGEVHTIGKTGGSIPFINRIFIATTQGKGLIKTFASQVQIVAIPAITVRVTHSNLVHSTRYFYFFLRLLSQRVSDVQIVATITAKVDRGSSR